MKYLTPSQSYGISFKQQFTMGGDSSTKLFAYDYVNVQMTPPDLNLQINGTQIVVLNSSSNSSASILTLNASASKDPMGLSFTYNWICPSYLGGSSCSASSSSSNPSILSFNYANLSSLSSNSLSSYYDSSH